MGRTLARGSETGQPLNPPALCDPGYALEIAPVLLRACVVTLLAAVSGMGVVFVLGFAVAMVRARHMTALAGIATAYVEFIRGTLLLIQL